MLCNMRRGLGACVSSVWTNVSELSGFLCAQRSFFWSPNNLINLLDVCRRVLAGTCWHISRMLNYKVCLLCVFGFSRLPMSHDMPWCWGSSAASHWPSVAADAKGGWCAWQKPLPMGALRMASWRMTIMTLASFRRVFYEFLWYILITYIYIYTIYVLICGDMCDTRMAFVL